MKAFEKIGIDLIGPLKEKKRGKRFIVVAIDYLTKPVEIDAIKEENCLRKRKLYI